ncbi:tripartite tricarboxylate transporter substrate binding protein [uncultured Pseudacidovorax sp.]|uniref:tripartite tricarboxylate transporter substrate binding protein n=1 Tax=uncultured Pseudacidovorax sp. TaxID=679313 RepID=UPI0025D90874|nr:tripartite tricarboxylate transporter substrate binding protein [uncultured Pseudacidovorax sp.]
MSLFARIARGLMVGALGGALLAAAHAEYPDRPLRLVVPFTPGGNIDATARIVAQGLSEQLGQPVVVDNRAGAGGVLGSELVARGPADGYTLLLGSSGALATSKALNPEIKLDPAKDLVAASPIARAPLLLVVNPALPVKTVADYIAHAKANPGKVTVASSGSGTAAHLTAELFQIQAGVKLLHVPYKGSSPAIADLLGGQVDSSFDQLASTLQQIRSGKLRAIGVTTARRSAIVPDIPTLAESGLPGFEASTTAGLMVPAGTPAPVIARLQGAMAKVLQAPDIRQKFEALGSDVVTGSGADFDALLRTEIAKWSRVVKEAGVEAR